MVPLKAVALPALCWIVLSVVWLFAAALGVPRGFDGTTLTLTEATAVASYADVERLLRAGADPNAPSRLRAGLVRNADGKMTPLDAATAAIRNAPVQMLVEHGARIDDTNFARLWCEAVARRNRDMTRFLDAQRPDHPPVNCGVSR